MTQLQQIEAFVTANPGATSGVVAAHLGVARNRVGAALQYLFKRGRLHRELAGTTITNVPFYAYYPANHKPSENVVKASENVARRRKAPTR